MGFYDLLNNKSYLDLEKYIDLQTFDLLHSEICRGISTASKHAFNGIHTINPNSINPAGQGYAVKPLYEIYSIWNNLPDTDPLKIAGNDLNHNQLTDYLKFAFGAYDLYSNYKIINTESETTGLGETAKHFPKLVDWIMSFKTDGILSNIYSASLMSLEAGGIPWEHCDPEGADDFVSEFIHIKTDLDRPFYMLDTDTRKRTYINTRVAWWNEKNWHGGEPVKHPTYTLRINGNFSDVFKNKVSNEHVQTNRT